MSRTYRHLSFLALAVLASICSCHKTSPEERTSVLSFPSQLSEQGLDKPRYHSAIQQPNGRAPASSIILPANNQILAAKSGEHSRISSASLHNNNKQLAQNKSLSSSANFEQSSGSFQSSSASSNVVRDEGSTPAFFQQKQQNEGKNTLRGTIEMALRQTSGDESYFQASPAIDWLASRQDPLMQTGSTGLSSSGSHSDYRTHLSGEAETTATPESQTGNQATEESNLILDAATSSGSTDAPTIQQRDLSSTRPSANTGGAEEPQSSSPRRSPEQTNESSTPVASGTFELSNNVVYEGPATAPPVGDFYFPTSDRLPNEPDTSEYRAPNVWWNIGVGQEFERASNLTRDDFLEYCSKSEILVSEKQRSLCRLHPKMMAIIARGLRMAFDECQSRFSSGRWNCSMVLAESLEQNHLTPRSQPFGEVIQKPNRERSFLNAIISAGIAHAMTKACSQGEMPEECSCDKRIRSRSNKGKIEWVACSDDIDFGARFSREFTDQMEGDSDTTSMINSHNYEVGRRIFKSATDITCTCQNGENGLCQTKKCWKHLSPFTEIGDELTRRYESATHVQVSSKDPRKLRPVRRGVRKPKRKDLVFIDESPDYCEENSRLGILGTQNRRCNSTTLAIDSCSILCCGRGYQVMIEEVEEDCNCKFVWCCKVKCDRCKRQMTVNICN